MKKNIAILVVLAIAITTVALAQTTTAKPAPVKKKYSYCQLFYNYLWDKIDGNKHEYIMSGAPSPLENTVENAGNLPKALNLIGADGWELVAAYHESIQLGTQYTYCFKKEVN